MSKQKLVSLILIPLFFISGMGADFTLAAPGGAVQSPGSTLSSSGNRDGLVGAPDVLEFMTTSWRRPLSMDEVARIEGEAMVNVYSEPEVRLFPSPTTDGNETSVVQTDDAGEGAIESLQESGWPWQPWPKQRKDFPALPTAPVLEGRWWPKKDYSTLSFDIQIDLPVQGSLYIWTWIVQDQDTHSRYLTFWFDNNFVQQFVVGYYGFKSSVYVPPEKINPALTRHRVEISINYCGLVDRGWKLLYTWVGNGTGPSADYQQPPLSGLDYPYDLTELTPRTSQTHCVMEYVVLAGPNTVLSIVTQNFADTLARTIYIYFEKNDGTYELKGNISTGGAFNVLLGDRPDDCYRKLKLEFRYLPDIDYAKRITTLAVYHDGWKLEVDYMPGTPISTLQAQIEYMIAYYKLHSYHTVTYSIDTVLPDERPTTSLKHEEYFKAHFFHKGVSLWEYVIYVEDLEYMGKHPAGWHYAPSPYGIRLADWGIAINDDYSYMWCVIMHEYGHHIYILEWYPYQPEVYCWNHGCVMSDAGGNGWYCFYHWWLRQTP